MPFVFCILSVLVLSISISIVPCSLHASKDINLVDRS